jgi:lysophospholipase L1-like esterase
MNPLFVRLIALLCSVSATAIATAARAKETLPVFHKGDVMVFQGDSITDGGRQRTGNDFNHTMGQDYAYIISAEIGTQLPERDLTFINRGISGSTIVDVQKRWQTDVIDLKPNLLSILFGINDTLHKNETVQDFETTYDRLLAQTLKAMPDVKIVLGEPFLLPVGKHKDVYSAELAEVKKRQEAVARLAEKYHLPLIKYQAAFDDACTRARADHWSWDGVHPTYAGHGLMVEQWLLTVNQAWPKG